MTTEIKAEPTASSASSSQSPSSKGIAAAAGSTDADDAAAKKKKDGPKKRKVGQACVYCRRSHMTCDSERPCKRCIKRDIGHLCHDETPGKGHGHAHHAMPKNKPPPAPTSAVSHSASPPAPSASASHAGQAPPVPATASDSTQSTLMGPPASIPTSSASSGAVNAASLAPVSGKTDPLQAYIAALTQGQAAASASATGPYSSQSPAASARGAANTSRLDIRAEQPSVFRPGVGPSGPRQSLGGLSSDALGTLVMGSPAAAVSNTSGLASSPERPSMTEGVLASMSGMPGWPSITSSAAGLGGAGFLGLGGSDGPAYGGMGRGGDAAGGHEFNLLSEFLESLDGPASMVNTVPEAANHSTAFGTPGTSNATQPWAATSDPARQFSSERPSKATGMPPHAHKRQRSSRSPDASPTFATTFSKASASNGNDVSDSANKGAYAPPTLKGFSTKTEKFFLTAADQVDGPRDERLSKVIQAKYDAGLLRPYNHVKGYARLSTWMDRNVSNASRRRILKPLSIFRPRFRAVAQSLSDVDLIYIEEAFERLLLDYDRVFSTQGIPACLWRRTGEIYKGNREFAELVGVGIEELREGKMGIYELMEEESACNYWEKYGAVSFDPGQKAVLTSCVLLVKQGGAPGGTFARQSLAAGPPSTDGLAGTPAKPGEAAKAGSAEAQEQSNSVVSRESASANGATTTTRIHCCFSFTIRRDAYGCPILVAGNFLPTS
ncbi:unnamed protein product [Parajaminaea phylloscopi]